MAMVQRQISTALSKLSNSFRTLTVQWQLSLAPGFRTSPPLQTLVVWARGRSFFTAISLYNGKHGNHCIIVYFLNYYIFKHIIQTKRRYKNSFQTQLVPDPRSCRSGMDIAEYHYCERRTDCAVFRTPESPVLHSVCTMYTFIVM